MSRGEGEQVVCGDETSAIVATALCRRIESAARIERGSTSTQRRRYSPLLWLNLVCLDAPIVAVAWQQLFATTFAVPVRPANRAALFLTAWLIYLADRFGDSVSLPRNARRSRRQEFCARHRKLWLVALGFVALADACLIATGLEFGAVVAGVVIGGIALIYLVVNQRWSQLWRILPMKEMTIGLLFAAGTMASLLPAFPALTTSFILSAALFAVLCTLNCICIARWERELDLAQRRGSMATAWPRVAQRVLWPTLVLVGVALAFSVFDRAAASVYVCIGFSAAGLAVLDTVGDDLPGDVRTACADLVLFTPIAVMLWRALRFRLIG